jgi:AraC-like DNA-binding protein
MVFGMSRAPREPVESTALVPALLRFARGRGASIPELAARFDLAVEAAEADEASMAPGAIASLFDAVADACGEPWVGLRLAAELPPSRAYALLTRELQSSRTVGDALDVLARHSRSVHPKLTASRHANAPGATWTQTYASAPRGVGRHTEEYGLAFVLSRCREACATTPLHARAVSFTHARPRDILPLERFFGTDALTFGAEESSFSLSAATIEVPVLVRAARRPAEPTGAVIPPAEALDAMTARVRTALLGVPARSATLEEVARSCGMSDRTLQRRLEAERTSFVEIQDTVREARARELLRDPRISLVDIAEQLGFSDLATFSRAFKRWTGQPPGMFRRKSIP